MSRATYALDATGRALAVPLRLARGVELVAVKIRCVLETQIGTWPSDRLFGLPLLRWAEAPGTPLLEYEGAVRLALSTVPEVVRVVSVVAAMDGDTLRITGAVQVLGEAGEIVSIDLAALVDPRGPESWQLVIRTKAIHGPPGSLIYGPRTWIAATSPPYLPPAGAWATWDPMLSPGEITGTDYGDLPDISGHGRHMLATVSNTLPQASAHAHATSEGTSQRLPDAYQYVRGQLRYLGDSAGISSDFTWLSSTVLVAPIAVSRALTGVLTTSAGSARLYVAVGSSSGNVGPYTLTYRDDAGAYVQVPGSPTLSGPTGADAAYRGSAWLVQLISRVGGTWRWRVVVDQGEGAGPTLLHDVTWADAPMGSLYPLSSIAGYDASIQHPFAGASVWSSAVDEVEALTWGCSRFASGAPATIRALLES